MIDDRVTVWLCALLGVGFLSVPVTHVQELRAQFLGAGAPPHWAGAAVLAVSVLLAGWSLVRKRFAWADPAWLTWSDFDGSRTRVLYHRLLRVWAARFAVVAYLTVVVGLLLGMSWPVAQASVFVLAAGAALVVAWPGVHSGRADLVRRFRERMVRRTAWAFLDPWALLPSGRAVAWRAVLSGRLLVVRFVVAGMLARGRSLPVALALVAVAALAHVLFPAVDPAWWLGLGAYGAGMPFAGGLAALTRSRGLRRWVGHSDREIRVTAAVVLMLFMAAWAGLAVALGVSLTGHGALALVVAAAAVVRTVTRSGMDFGNLGVTSVAGILMPVGLLVQTLHGPDLLVICLLLLGTGALLAVPVSLALSAAATIGFRTPRPG
ncbi:DUF6297 family protein [Amycolatopsis viridis]|uniref:Integral membrane protein n=1 Tax=Amycolatopsis viridis TaxID=185678 RepID=A0ABX0SYR9_9PSEU|nr:DUF6297 family protein [Amycolatopsis viridis]NIH82112.1 hypothetical protein [Amycolatopsis viridis]